MAIPTLQGGGLILTRQKIENLKTTFIKMDVLCMGLRGNFEMSF